MAQLGGEGGEHDFAPSLEALSRYPDNACRLTVQETLSNENKI